MIEDGESFAKAGDLGFEAQLARAEAVKCADPRGR